ncbi:helix-turn-helix domain-containing protein [Dactylosporangium sp. CA-092794]|uniref:helix-turn-helix domain-containing protein n=1 Tax=Dactylosporangium sp. CA-092794 TaxID=3239929 RepID=UPI003D8C4BBA
MISPHVRRQRLASELIKLREEHGYSTQRLAMKVGIPRQRISQLQNGHLSPDLDDIIRILDVFNVGERRWEMIMSIARDAQGRGWWEKYREEMGPRQALIADLEAGARSIVEYQMTLLPGLLQTPAFTEVRARADRGAYPEHFDPSRALEARAMRQRVLERAGGPTYEVIIDELAVRRHAAPPEVVRGQLDHLVELGRHRKKITIRILPLSSSVPGHVVPRSSFFTYRYPDPGDPIVVAVDTLLADDVLTDPAMVSPYIDLFKRIQQAALSPTDSLNFLANVAEELPRYPGSHR